MSLEMQKRAQQLIVERARRLRHSGLLEPADATATAENPSCGDRVLLSLRLCPASQHLAAVNCATRGCVLCTASADLMAEVLHGRTSHQALELGKAFVALLSGATEPSGQDPALECLRPLAGMAGQSPLHPAPLAGSGRSLRSLLKNLPTSAKMGQLPT